MSELRGHVAIVTGAAGGVGRAVATRFAAEGASVMLSDEDDKGLTAIYNELREAGRDVAKFHCEINARLGAKNLVSAAIDAFDRVDAVVNGGLRPVLADPMSAGARALDRALDQSLKPAFLLTQAAAQRMIEQERAGDRPAGSIVTIGSIAAQRTAPEVALFSIACAALDQMTRAMSATLADRGVRVNGVALGGVVTASLKAALAEGKVQEQDVVASTPLGRIGAAEEAAEACLYLASPRASFVTGQVLTVDGGRTLLDPLHGVESWGDEL